MTVAKRKKVVAKKNKAFRRMTAAQKRVAIARDVIAAVQSQKILALSGTYVKHSGIDFNCVHEETSLQDLLKQNEGRCCEACAVGSILICAAKRFNKVSVGDVVDFGYADRSEAGIGLGDRKCFVKFLEKYFSKEQLVLIEAAFERKLTGLSLVYSEFTKSEEFQRSVQKYQDKSLSEALVAIMRNIIRNKGTFVP
jgi:hypothetical protein